MLQHDFLEKLEIAFWALGIILSTYSSVYQMEEWCCVRYLRANLKGCETPYISYLAFDSTLESGKPLETNKQQKNPETQMLQQQKYS